MEKKLILNRIKTPDGTILTSHHRHDYVTYLDKNGLEYMIDGGLDYQRYTVHEDAPFENLAVYSDESFEIIRQSFHRGGRGKDGRQPLTWVPMDKMSDSWLQACIDYNEENGSGKSFASEMYRKEIEYRKLNNISINDSN